MYQRSIHLLIIVCWLSGSAFGSSSDIHPRAGTNLFPFLKLSYDIRGIGMGGSYCALPNRVFALLSNPAGLTSVPKSYGLIGYKPIILDIRGMALGYTHPQSDNNVWGVSLQYISYGTFDLKDEQNNPITGEISPYSCVGSVSWGKRIYQNLSCGVTFKGIYDLLCNEVSGIFSKTSASGFAFDIGSQYTLSSRLIYGVLFKNIGIVTSNYSDALPHASLPFSMGIGLSYIFKNYPYIRTAIDFEKPLDDYLQYRIGFEFTAYKQMLFLRSGLCVSHRDIREFLRMIRNGALDDTYQKSNWSLINLGFGINSQIQGIEYSIDAASVLRVSSIDPEFNVSIIFGL